MSTNHILDKRKPMKMYDKGFAQSGHTIANRTYSQRPTDTPPNAQFPPRPKSSHSPYSLSKPIDSIHPCALERTLSKMMSPIIKLFYLRRFFKSDDSFRQRTITYSLLKR